MAWVLNENYRRRNSNERPEWIVVHYPGMPGASARRVRDYFYDEKHKTSSHFVVDDVEVLKALDVKYAAYHVGGKKTSLNGCYNGNSIGIDLCDDKVNRRSISVGDDDWFVHAETMRNAARLIAGLMRQYNIPIERVVRHYDVTHKRCPRPLVGNDASANYPGMTCNELWEDFKKKCLSEYRKFGK